MLEFGNHPITVAAYGQQIQRACHVLSAVMEILQPMLLDKNGKGPDGKSAEDLVLNLDSEYGEGFG